MAATKLKTSNDKLLFFPKAPKKATHVKLTVGKYKKAVVRIQDRDTLAGVSGVLEYGFLEAKRIFRSLDIPYNWIGNTYIDENGNPYAEDGEGSVSLSGNKAKSG